MNKKIFPNDCTSDCPHWCGYDLSIDDWVYGCKKLKCEVDVGWCVTKLLCPLHIKAADEEESHINIFKNMWDYLE